MKDKKSKIEVEELEEVSGGIALFPSFGLGIEAGDITTIDGHVCECGSTHFEYMGGEMVNGKLQFGCVNPNCNYPNNRRIVWA